MPLIDDTLDELEWFIPRVVCFIFAISTDPSMQDPNQNQPHTTSSTFPNKVLHIAQSTTHLPYAVHRPTTPPFPRYPALTRLKSHFTKHPTMLARSIVLTRRFSTTHRASLPALPYAYEALEPVLSKEVRSLREIFFFSFFSSLALVPHASFKPDSTDDAHPFPPPAS